MIQKEINEFLANTKVYVAGKSKEILEKLFTLGYEWKEGGTDVIFTEYPFLYIDNNHHISYGSDMCVFSEHEYREISFEEILQITGPTYRPFKTQEECWNEMLKHQPFGWVKAKDSESPRLIGNIYLNIDEEVYIVWAYNGVVNSASNTFYNYTFADGTPFGIKED